MTNAPGRFIVGHFRGGYGRTVILRDTGFWAQHEQALDQWCREHAAVRQGMTVDMDDVTLSLFVLRWS